MNWKKLASLGVVAMMSLSILGCGSDSASNTSSGDSSSISGSVTGSGSSALLPLAKDAADKFKELHPEVSITLNGGGSGTGLKQVADGSVDIGNSDVAADTKLDKAVADGLVDHKVCVVTMAPVINKDIAISSSIDIISDIAYGIGPKENLIALGYSSWAPQQLENEIKSNSWLVLQPDNELIFHTKDEEKWQKAIDELGIDISRLSTNSGHA